jgi:drug/metabolite transporter (DMT)-like permease
MHIASLFILISAILYGVSPILAKVAFGYGVPPLTLLALRSTVAAACLWLGLLVTRTPVRLPRSALVSLLAIGGTLLPVQVFSYFWALRYLPASSASVIANSAPLHVAWMGWLFLGERLRRDETAVLGAVALGAVLVAGQTPHVRGGLPLVALGVGTLLSAVYIVVARRLMRDVLPLAAMAVLLPVSACVYWSVGLVTRQLMFTFPLPAFLAVLGSALTAVLTAPLLVLTGLRTITAARAAMLGMLEPVITVGLSILLLGDFMTPLRAVGIVIVISGIAVLHVRRPA